MILAMSKLHPGWVRRVNGRKVARNPVGWYSSGWTLGKPVGIVHHATAGCGDLAGLHNVLQSRRVSAHFGIDRAGNIAQFVSLRNRAWHACDANAHWFGVEHIALPQTCPHTPKQLEVSADLFAGLIEWAGQHYGSNIPVAHKDGTPPPNGIAGHIDGGAAWGSHSDTVTYAPAKGWTWAKYLDAIRAALKLDKGLH